MHIVIQKRLYRLKRNAHTVKAKFAVSVMLDPKDLMVMVHEVNRTTVSENEFLSDSVYMYCKADDSITKA